MADAYILAIDYGAQRVGLAVAHEIARIPTPIATLENNAGLLEQLKDRIAAEHAHTVIVGLPRNMDGSLGFQAEAVQAFANELEKKLGRPVILVDETLSSVDASTSVDANTLARVGLDAVAAAVILQRYLASKSSEMEHDV